MQICNQKNICLKVLISVLMLSLIFSLGFNTAIQMTSIVHKGYYRLFKNGTVIGNIKSDEDIKTALKNQYGTKVPEAFYFGEGVSMEYAAYDEPVSLTDPVMLLPELDIQVEGLNVRTDKGKEFKAASYHDWQEALGNTLKFVQNNDKEIKKNMVPGEVRVVENFQYTYKKMSIDDASSQKELEQQLIFQNIFETKKDTVQPNDTLASVAKRNHVSQEQLVYVNEIDKDMLLLPGTTLNVSPLHYAVDFAYPIIENVTEEIKFTIEYQDDDAKYNDEEEIIQAGVNGVARAQYLSYMVNSQSVPGERLAYQVLQEPVKQIIKRGTKERSHFSTGSDAPYANIAGFIWPTRGLCISAGYMDPTYPGAHYGLDIAGNYREDVWSAAAGTVESAEFSGALGNQVLVNHHNGLKTRYAHLSSIGVNLGTQVKQGTYIGAMGSTGRSTGVHLHFEVHTGGSRVDPLPYLPQQTLRRC